MNKFYKSKIRDYHEGEKIWTHQGYIAFPNIEFDSNDIEEEDFQLCILFENSWYKVQNIDFK